MRNRIPEIPFEPGIGEQARWWFVRMLDEDVTLDEIKTWQAWLSESPMHRSAYDRVSDAWCASSKISMQRCPAEKPGAESHDGPVPAAQLQPRLAPRPWRSQWRKGTAAVAAIAALLIVADLADFASLRELGSPPVEALTTVRAEHKRMTLPDGSVLQLGAMTSVQVRFSSGRRTVRIDHGEAYFVVAHDAARPFVVETPFGPVTAVGTAFNVDLNQKRLALTVTDGAVIVRPHEPGSWRSLSSLLSQPVRVSVGQRLDVDATTSSSPALSIRGAPAQITWPTRQFVYRNEPLQAVAEDVNRYAQQPIIIGDEVVGAMSYTGTVRVDAIDEWGTALAAAFPVSVIRQPDGTLLLVKKK